MVKSFSANVGENLTSPEVNKNVNVKDLRKHNYGNTTFQVPRGGYGG